MTRKYTSGTSWCVWRWTDVDSKYLTRLHIVKTPWFAVCLHWLHKPDPEPYLHNHPVSFLSVILRGAYTELRIKPDKRLWYCPPLYLRHKWFNYIRACFTDRHRIVAVLPGTLTLCFMGPKKQDWGFFTPKGWVYWKDYYRGDDLAVLRPL